MTRGAGSLAVLCVDGNLQTAERTAASLERADDRFSVSAVAGVRAGLDALAEGDFDCVVSAYDLPDGDGVAFLETVRSDRPDLPFVLFAGEGDEEVAGEAIAAGVTGYVPRESETDRYSALARRIREAVERRRGECGAAADATGPRSEADGGAVHARSETVLGSSPDAILVIVDRTLVFANPAAVDLFDAENEADLTGRNVFEFVSSDDRTDVDAELARVEGGTETTSGVRRTVRTLGGREVTVEVTAWPIEWNGASGSVAVVRDVSEREVREHERTRYAAAFAEAMDAIVVADDDGAYLDANRSACELFGVSREELLGMRVDDFAADDHEMSDAWSEFLSAGDDRGMFTLVRPDGERRIVEYAATSDVVPGEHLSVLRDVTDRVELAERLRTDHDALKRMYRITADAEASFEEKVRELLELGTEYLNVPYGFLTRIEDGMQTFVHAVGDHELIHSDDSGPLSETYCRKTVDADELVTVQDAVAEGWATDTAFERYDFGCYIGSKAVVDGDLYGTFCFAGSDPREEAFSDGEKAFVELMSRWVSYELERLRHTRELRNQTKRLDEFASMVSHDLRNPLSVANGYLNLAREGGDPETFDRAAAALDRMDRIIGDLLYLARENEQIRETEPVDLESAVERAWETVGGAGGEATLDVGDGLGVVTADPNRLAQLLENVFRNAVEHADPDVRVRVVPTEDGFAVEDDGPGIPAERREDVFSQGYTTRREGTGFGLSIVEQIADGHGWTVSVADADVELGGARFEVGGVR